MAPESKMVSNRSALLIGVGEYSHGLQPLPGSDKDVSELGKVLQNPERGGFLQVELLTNPTLKEMGDNVEDFFSEGKEDDLLLFYFSGHAELVGANPRNRNLYFCAKDTGKKSDGQLQILSAMPADFLKECLKQCKSRQVVVILDCCYSGTFGKLITKDATNINGEASIHKELSDSLLSIEDIKKQIPGVVLLSSSRPEEASYTKPDEPSAYTQTLIQGIQGAADSGQSQWISAYDLHKYASHYFGIPYPETSQPQIFVTRDEAKLIPVARATESSPQVRYQRIVKEKFSRLSEEYIYFAGDLSNESFEADRNLLENFYKKSGLSQAEAQAIENVEKRPYEIRANNRREYQKQVRLICRRYRPFFSFSENDQYSLRISQEVNSISPHIAKKIEADIIKSLTNPEETPTTTPDKSNKISPHDLSEIIDFRAALPRVQTGIFGRKVTISIESCRARRFSENVLDNTKINMVYTDQGEFLMGASKWDKECHKTEHPQHSVKVPSFWISETPITQEQWREVVKLPVIELKLDAKPSFFNSVSDDYPVEQVSWFEALEFCQRLSKYTNREYRLPSEAEWEYACRAGSQHPFYFGSTLNAELANYGNKPQNQRELKEQTNARTTQIQKFKPNAFGLYDMYGNVWEWCADHWHETYADAPQDASAWIDPAAPFDKYRSIRGGAWDSPPNFCRSSARNGISPNERLSIIGFRIVLSSSG